VNGPRQEIMLCGCASKIDEQDAGVAAGVTLVPCAGVLVSSACP